MSDNKQQIINDIYFDRSGFSSKSETLKDAKKKDASINMDDINKFFRENVEQKRKPRGQNSFIPSHSFFEFQLDLFFISNNDLENQKFRVGLVLIDIFSKYATVIPINSKQPADVLAGLMEGIQKMGGKPEMIYSDEEGSLNSSDILEYLKEQKIELHRTRGHPAFAERFIRTFKDMLFKRVDADKAKDKQNIQWVDYILEIMLTYNEKLVSSTTKFTPKQARLKKNELEVKLNIASQAKKTRIYPELDINDRVKVMRKKGITEKENTSHWLKAIQKITRIQSKLGQKYYYLDGENRGYLRHELLKV